jgi:drug/metabolite transporter (DMT)-like permease
MSAEGAPPPRWSWLAPLVAVAMWASTFTVYKIAFRTMDPLAFVGVRYVLLVGGGLAYLAWTRDRRVGSRRDLRLAGLAGVFGYFLLELTFVLGLDRTSAIASSIMVATYPIWTVAFSAVATRRRPTPRELAGLAIGMAGVVVFLGGLGAFGSVKVGDLLSLGTAVTFGIYGAMTERIGDRVTGGELVASGLVVGGVLLLVVAVPAIGAQDWAAATATDAGLILYAAAGPIAVAFALWSWSIKVRGIIRTAPFGYLEPLIAIALAVAILGEAFAVRQVAGGGLILAGVILAAGSHAEVEEAPPAL